MTNTENLGTSSGTRMVKELLIGNIWEENWYVGGALRLTQFA